MDDAAVSIHKMHLYRAVMPEIMFSVEQCQFLISNLLG